MDVQFEVEADVPDLIAALALRFVLRGFDCRDACMITIEMLSEFMDGSSDGAMLH